MVRIGLDDLTQPCRVEILILALAQMHDDLGAASGIGKRLDRELALAVGHPAPALAFAGFAAQDLDLLGDHERRIEADAKLPDQTHVPARVARQLAHKSGGAGAGDRAEVVDQLLPVHADAVIADRKGAGGFIGGQRDAVFGIAFGRSRLGQRCVTQPVASIRCVRDQLA